MARKILHYGGLAHTGFTAAGTDTTASTVYDVNTPEGAWLLGIIITILAAICLAWSPWRSWCSASPGASGAST